MRSVRVHDGLLSNRLALKVLDFGFNMDPDV